MDEPLLIPATTAVLLYHYVRPDDAPMRVGASRVDLDTFAAQLDDLARTGTIVGWPQVAAALTGGPQLPSDAVMLTFDDGHDDHHRYVLPMLAERGLPGTFFILARDPAEGLTVAHRIHVLLALMTAGELRDAVVEALGPTDRLRYLQAELDHAVDPFDDPVDDVKWVLQRDLMDAAGPVLSRMVEELVGPEPEVAAALHLDARQIRELHAAGMTLGGHTHGHRWMDWLSREESEREIAASARQLSTLGPSRSWPFAYPYGAVPPDPAAMLRPAGFPAAFVATGTSRSDRYRLGRVDADSLGPAPSQWRSTTVPGSAP
jgi:peptidoglycan/xylan/chitin deacetylase (PgdA/CDA1 family)